MKSMSLILGVALLAASQLLADDDGLVFSADATQACLAGGKGSACIGLSAGKCMDDTVGGHTTYGMGGCLSREADFWDGRLNEAYQSLMEKAKESDAYNAENEYSVPSQAEALRDMQRAWIPYRDARCGYEYSLWGGGTGGGPASVSCFMQMTAEQALYLEAGDAWY